MKSWTWEDLEHETALCMHGWTSYCVDASGESGPDHNDFIYEFFSPSRKIAWKKYHEQNVDSHDNLTRAKQSQIQIKSFYDTSGQLRYMQTHDERQEVLRSLHDFSERAPTSVVFFLYSRMFTMVLQVGVKNQFDPRFAVLLHMST